MALAAEVLDRIPTEPGVYLFKDARGGVIYVGSADGRLYALEQALD